jgi:leucyl aminopeptidase
MKFTIQSGAAEKQRCECAVVGVFEDGRLSAAAQRLDIAGKGFISALLKRGDFNAKAGETLLLHAVPQAPAPRVLLAGCGKRDEFKDANYRKAVAAAVKAARASGARDAVVYLTEMEIPGRDGRWNVRQAAMAASDALYRFEQLKSEKNNARKLDKIVFNVASRVLKPAQQGLREGLAVADGVKLAKDLGNLPGNVCTPSYLAARAKELGKSNLKVTVLEKRDMERLGMGALLAVARGAREPAKLITLEYRGGAKGAAPVVLVGKGVTFDTGGISIKPAANMDEMKYDMSGAGSVLGTLAACAALALPLNVVGVIPATENMPGGNAVKPGDVVKSLSGQTIEILNTDAEGRLILCDALTYSERFKPDVVIDIATLTGACVVALGKHPSGVLGNDQPLIAELQGAGEDSGDRLWQLPLWDEYQEQLKSNFADMSNVGGREAGTITAACFLWRYTKKFRWAHLDIAGTAYLTGANKGSTGRPVPLLTHFLMNRCENGREKRKEKSN